MALAYRQTPAASQSAGTVTTYSVTKQTGTAAGDWIFIFLFGTNATTTACTGFTVLNDINSFACLLYRLADGTEGSSFSITGLGGARVSAVIATVSGAASALDGLTGPNSGGASTNIAVNTITLNNSNDWVLWFGANQNGFNNASFTITAPSGFTSRASIAAQANNPAIMVADNTSLGAGATGTKTGTCTSASFFSGVMVGISPTAVTVSGTATLSGASSVASPPRQSQVATLVGDANITGNVTTLVPGMSLSAAGSVNAPAVAVPAGALAFPGRLPNPVGFKCELNLNGTWTDITPYVMLRENVTIEGMGRQDEQSSISPVTLGMVLRNDGRFTPKNAGGAYYPNIVRNCQVRVSVNATSVTGVKYSGYRFHGEISSWPPGYDVSQRDTYVHVTASGLWRRVSQSQIPIGSCFWRYVQLLSGGASPAAYWGMEDGGSGSSAFVLSDGTGTNLIPTGQPSYAADGTSFGGSNALPQLNGARLAGNVTMSGTPSSYVVRFALSVPAAGDSQGITFGGGGWLAKILSTGTVATVIIILGQDSKLNVTGFSSGGGTLFSATISTKVNGVPVLVSYEQTGGAYALKIIKPGGTGVLDQVTSGGFSWTVGKITQVQVSPQGRLNDTTFGQLQVYSTNAVDIVTAAVNLGGRVGEQAADRFARLCAESNIPYQLTGSGGATLGPQVSDTMAAVLQSIEDSDGGMLYEPRDAIALGYRTLGSIMDQVPAAAFSHSSGVLGEPLEPTYDDQLIRNQWTLSNYDGYTVTAQMNTGSLSILSPPSGVGGGYAGSRDVNCSTHTLVNNLAQQLLDEGCCDEVRYPNVVINFQRAAAAPYMSTIPSMRPGDYFQITSLPAFLGGGTAKQLAWGYSETLGGEVPGWQITFNTIPELPFESSFSPGAATITQGTGGAVAQGSAIGSSVSGSQIGPGTVGTGELANTVTARKVGGTTTLISSVVPYDWSFNFSGTPSDTTYFTCTQDQAQSISQGDTFSTSVGYGSAFFTVTSTDPPAGGLVNVHFTPDSSAPMSGGLVYGGKNGDLWINTSQGNSLYQWFNGTWTQYQFGPAAMSFNVGGTKITFSVSAPSSPAVGDLWYNAGSGYQLSQWDGSTWQSYQYGAQAISAQSITSSHIVTGTVVAGIVNGTTVEGVYFIGGSGPGQNWLSAAPGVPGFFLYQDDGIANPQLIFAVAAGAGTDQWGNTWQGGATFTGLSTLLNVLSVQDTTGSILANIDYAGNISGQVLSGDDVLLGGTSVTDSLNDLASGIVARGWVPTGTWPSTPIGTTDTAILELDQVLIAGRSYRFTVIPAPFVPTATTQYVQNLRFTTDGSTPTTSSAGVRQGITPCDSTKNHMTPYMEYTPGSLAVDTTYRILVTAHVQAGTYQMSGSSTPLELRVEDIGPWLSQTNGNNGVALGSGTSGSTGTQNFTKTYYATSTHSYYGMTAASGFTPNGLANTNGYMYQSCGTSQPFTKGDMHSYATFNYAQIASDLTGAFINKVTLRLKCAGSYYSSGMTVILGWTSATSFGSTFTPGTSTHQNVTHYHINKGQTLTRDITSTGIGTQFQSGGATSIVIGPAFSYTTYTDQNNNGNLTGGTATSTCPALTITYTQ